MASTSISDFKITVKLDSSKAMAGLRSLHAKMNAFANSTRGSLAVQAKVNEKIKEKVSLFKKLINLARKLAFLPLKLGKGFLFVGKKLYHGLTRPISKITGMLGDWKWMLLAAAGAAAVLVTKVTRAGIAMERASIAMNAAIAGSTVGQGMSPQNLAKLQKNQLNFAVKLAKTYGLGLTDTVNEYAKFFAAASPHIGVEGTEKVFKGFAKLSTVYGLSADKQQRAMVAFTQMASKNQVMSEELKQQLAEVLPGSMQIFAKAITKTGKHGEVTVKKMYKLMEQGKIVASDVFPYVAQLMEEAADPTLNDALSKAAVKFSILKTQATATGAGIYNQFQKPLGDLIQMVTDFLSGKGMQTTVGKSIHDAFKYLIKTFTPLSEELKDFEERWDKATDEGKRKMLKDGTFFTAFFDGMKKVFNQVWDDLKLDKFATRITDILQRAVQSAWDNLDLSPKWYRNDVAWMSDLFMGVHNFFSRQKDIALQQKALGSQAYKVGSANNINVYVSGDMPSDTFDKINDYGDVQLLPNVSATNAGIPPRG